MIRTFLGMMAIALLASGCCGPMGCGPGCGAGHCYDCDGVGTETMAMGPLHQLRDVRRKMVCGSGCGETYRGEWISTPPDCDDPCCGDQFVGGAVAARPFCWQRGAIIGGLCGHIYGGRYCGDCGESIVDCGCGGEVIDGGYVEETSGCGCASCSSQNGATTRMATAQRTQSRTARRPVPRTSRTRTR